MDINFKEYGGIGDGKTLNTDLFQRAIHECSNAGGGKITISGGRYMTGKIILKSNVELHLAADGVLLGSGDCKDYPETETVKHVTSDKLPRWRNACLIFADECENISITGNGTIDCNGEQFVVKRTGNDLKGWTYVRKMDEPTPPRAVFFTGCRNVKIEDITMVNQPAGWSYWIHDCDYVSFDKVKIIANVNYPNNDGIHINCSRNVTISNCSITCGDDCIVMRANSSSLRENKVCERVVVTNCNLTSYSGGIRIAWMNDGIIRNCTFSNLVMTDTSNGISFLLPHMVPDRRYPGSADMGREATLVENLSFNNIIMDKICSNPIVMNISENPETQCRGINNIYFTNIHARGPELPQIIGRESCHFHNIHFNDCTFEVTDGSEFDNRFTHGYCTYYDGKRHDMEIRYVDNLRFNNTAFTVL